MASQSPVERRVRLDLTSALEKFNSTTAQTVKQLSLKIASLLGLFRLARWLTRRQLRILCYHGISLQDEHRFKPGLFMQAATFKARLSWLQANGYAVIPLSQGLQQLSNNKVRRGEVVITIDDGWYGSYSHMAKALHEQRMPATLYLATYYVNRQFQVFNVAVDYVLWKTRHTQLDLNALGIETQQAYDLTNRQDRRRVTEAILVKGESLTTANARQDLLKDLCSALDVDYARIVENRLLAFMTKDEARELAELGVDLQLHTHRHRFPADDFQAAEAEILDNRKWLKQINEAARLDHFCYPSGAYEAHQLDWLKRLDVLSATTTKAGLASAQSPKLELPRLLDSNELSEIEFAAELSGFKHLLRRAVGRV